MYFCGPRAGELEPEEVVVWRIVFWSITDAGKDVGGAGDAGLLPPLKLRREFEREKDAVAAGAGSGWWSCWRGVKSNSLSS